MIGSMERNAGGRLIYKTGKGYYAVLDCRVFPFKHWGTLPGQFSVWQNIGQLKIWFLAVEYDEASPVTSAERGDEA